MNWNHIAIALANYKAIGYKYKDVPWMVGEPQAIATQPPGVEPFRVFVRTADNRDWEEALGGQNVLVGSAEQGFVKLFEQLVPGQKYVSCSPCFRTEPAYNIHTRPWFMKVELFVAGPFKCPQEIVEQTCNHARVMMKALGGNAEIVPTTEGFGGYGLDLIINTLEVGSYGYRESMCNGKRVSWVYGTGLAEPRFSQAIGVGLDS
jgi:seryl-tRNA synthetase